MRTVLNPLKTSNVYSLPQTTIIMFYNSYYCVLQQFEFYSTSNSKLKQITIKFIILYNTLRENIKFTLQILAKVLTKWTTQNKH